MSPRLKVATNAVSPALLSLLRKDNAPSLGEQTGGTATSLLLKDTTLRSGEQRPTSLLRKDTVLSSGDQTGVTTRTTPTTPYTTVTTAPPAPWVYSAEEMRKIRVDTRMLHPDVRLLTRKLGVWSDKLTCLKKAGHTCQFLKHTVGQHKTCAVVGNGGILLNSSCGAEIDSKDYVIRMDLPAIRGFETDVGRKTNITFLNTSTPNRVERSSLLRNRSLDVYESRLRDINGSVLVSGDRQEMTDLKKAMETYKTHDVPFSFVLLTSHGSFKLGRLIRRTAAKVQGNPITSSAPSTGLATILTATAFCDRIYMYGFFPFHKLPRSRKLLPYHYYPGDSIEPIFLDSRHRMDKEYRFFQDLHSRGVVKMHVGKCQNRTVDSA
ncbi:CMP-N-acetylneuraminate-poly-alpha-2,8-sialyltransferase-like [Branchiostoma floridae x Branchiostoma belcheri]